jgi:hypothetical protein
VILAAAALWLVTAPAAAQTRVGPLVTQVTPPASVEVGERFQNAVAEGLRRIEGLELVPQTEVRRALGDPELLACDAAPCLSRLAAELRALRLVRCSVTMLGKAYAVGLRVYDQFGREVVRLERRCEICTLAEAEETITRAAADLGPALLVRRVPPPPASLPSTSPASLPASRPAPQPWAVPEPPGAASQSGAPPPLGERLKTWNWRLYGIVSAGIAAVALGVGIPLAAIANEPTCDRPDARRTCPEIYATTGASAAFLTIGVLAAGAAGTSFYLSWRFGRERSALVMPLAGPASAGVAARLRW